MLLCSRDHKGEGMAHKITSPKNQPMMWQYWLGKKRSTIATDFFFKNYVIGFLLLSTDW